MSSPSSDAPQVKTYQQTRYVCAPGFGKRKAVARRVFQQSADAPLPCQPQDIEEVDPSTPLHDWQDV